MFSAPDAIRLCLQVVAQVPGLADLAGPAARAPVALVAQDALLHTQLFGLLAQSFMGFS